MASKEEQAKVKRFQQRLETLKRTRGASWPVDTKYVPEMAEFFSRKDEPFMSSSRDLRDSTIARAKVLEGHDKMTDKSMAEIKRRKLKADAEKPGAGMYAKARAKVNEVTGFKKGGSVSSASKRGDGCATKGKTKGRFV
jgi:hypothetical protein